MGTRRMTTTFLTAVSFAGLIFLPARSQAQESADPDARQPNTDAPGCTDLRALSRLPVTIITSCDQGDSIEVTVPLEPDAQGNAREKSLRGAYEFREYQLLEARPQDQVFDDLTRLLGIAGFTLQYSSSPSTITARNGDTWMLLETDGNSYDVRVVHVKEDPWTPVKDAQGISREIEAHHRVAIYGIEFSPDNRTIIEQDSGILGQMLSYLEQNSGVTFELESHKTSANGNADTDLEITRLRAQAVVAWLEAHGVASGRLEVKACGRDKPIAENDTPLGSKRNDRIELARAAP
jgi:outer membrane protein OmpA-like peptidoglycan-associated protein